MSSRSSFLVLIVIGLVFSAVSAAIVISDPMELLNPGMWLFIAVSIAVTCAGIYKFFQSLFKSFKEKRVRKNGYHATGTVCGVEPSASVNTMNNKTEYYFVTVKFTNDMGEECLYQVSDHYDKHTTAWFIKKGVISIIQGGKTCFIDEDTDGAIDIEDAEANRLIKPLLNTKVFDNVANGVNGALKTANKVDETVSKIATPIMLVLFIIFGLCPLILGTIIVIITVIFVDDLIARIICGIIALLMIASIIAILRKIKKYRDYNL